MANSVVWIEFVVVVIVVIEVRLEGSFHNGELFGASCQSEVIVAGEVNSSFLSSLYW